MLPLKRVSELAEKYHYQPNAIALSLRSNKTKTIGVIIPEIAHFFFATVISGIEDLAAKHGYSVLLCHSNELYEREVQQAKAMFSHQVDGLLISISKQTSKFDHFEPFRDKNRPVIFFDRVPEGIEAATVTVEDKKGAFEAVEHLIEQGCRRIIHLAGPEHLSISILRKEGYIKALQKHGISVDPELIIDCNRGAHLDEADEIMSAVLDKGIKFDGVFANNDLTAVGAIKAIKARGIKIPEQIAVIGYSNWQLAALVEPALSSVNQPGYEMGQIAAEMFFDQIKNPNKPLQNKVLETSVVVRASSLRS